MVKKTKPKSDQDDILLALADMNEAIGLRFDKVDARLDGTYDRFEKIDRQLLEMRSQLDRIEAIVLSDHERRIGSIEKQLRAIK